MLRNDWMSKGIMLARKNELVDELMSYTRISLTMGLDRYERVKVVEILYSLSQLTGDKELENQAANLAALVLEKGMQ